MLIALAQIDTCMAGFDDTSQRIVELSRRAVEEGAGLLVLPAIAFGGLCPPTYVYREGFYSDGKKALEQLALDVACPCLIPMPANTEDGAGFEAILLKDGVAMPVWLASTPQAETAETQGLERAVRNVFDLDGIRFAFAYSYECIEQLKESDSDIDVLLYCAGRGFALDDASSAMGASLLEGRFRDDAWALDAWVVGVGALGGYDLQVFTGSSFVLSPKGELVACAPAFEEALLVAPIVTDDKNAVAEVLEPELYDRSLHLWEALALGLRDHLHKRGHTEVAIMLDGRLNSSVLATLASDALGPTHVHALINDGGADMLGGVAKKLARTLHLDLVEENSVGAVSCSDSVVWQDVSQLRLANLARRTHAVALVDFDKTFFAVEAEEVGCGAASLAPFGDVYRSDLVEIAHLRNTISPVIDAAIVNSYSAPPIKGLKDVEATIESQLRRVDVTLSAHIEWERSLSDVVARHGCREVSERIIDEFVKRSFARLGLPPCLIVSSRTVREADVPSDLAWRDRVRADDERLGSTGGPAGVSDLFVAADSVEHRAESESAVAAEIEQLLEQMHTELVGASRSLGNEADKQVDELLGLLRDILQDGVVQGSVASGSIPFGPLTWGSPFSEN